MKIQIVSWMPFGAFFEDAAEGSQKIMMLF
jgi:hypothetical protein